MVTLVRPGESPATYQPTDAEVTGVMRATVYFRAGVPFENGRWFEEIEAADRVKIVDLRRNISLREMARHVHDPEPHVAHHGESPHAHPEAHDPSAGEHEHEHEDHSHAGKDPHIWLSPPLLKTQADQKAVSAEVVSRLIGQAA